MSLWWTKKRELDDSQLHVIETLPLRQNSLILGPPGSGKTNVLVRRAQFVRSQGMPNVLVLSFTRALTEFIKTGCYNTRRQEIFPVSRVTTIESWIRYLYSQHNIPLPDRMDNLTKWKRHLASTALGMQTQGNLPKYDALFVDESQDLLAEEVSLIQEWSDVLFFVGDDRQRMYKEAEGLDAVLTVPGITTMNLPFHYRLAPEICRMADRILSAQGRGTLGERAQYTGPSPATVETHGPLAKDDQLEQAADTLKQQIRIYDGFIQNGDKLAVVTARKDDREQVFNYFERDPVLQGKTQIIRAPDASDDYHDPSLDPNVPICIMTVQACKGLEFRAVHWLFCEVLRWHHDNEIYYTIVTRAKTSLELYYASNLPSTLAGAYEPTVEDLW